MIVQTKHDIRLTPTDALCVVPYGIGCTQPEAVGLLCGSEFDLMFLPCQSHIDAIEELLMHLKARKAAADAREKADAA